MKRIATLLVLCGAGTTASAWGFLGGIAAIAAGTERESAANAAPGICVRAFSKDGCDGVIEPGHYEVLGCNTADCRTIRVTDAVYATRMNSSNLTCGGTCDSAKCDEFRDGDFIMKIDYVLRADSCCPYRGSWTGEWEFVTDAGLTYKGTAHGTIGIGTNRDSACLTNNDACEKCYDVELLDTGWLIGFEGSFRGVSAVSPTINPNELNFTMDGTWLVSPDAREPFRNPFRVYSRFDGASVEYCP